MNHVSRNPLVPAAHPGATEKYPGVRVHFFLVLTVCQFHLQSMATLVEGDQSQMWEFICI